MVRAFRSSSGIIPMWFVQMANGKWQMAGNILCAKEEENDPVGVHFGFLLVTAYWVL